MSECQDSRAERIARYKEQRRKELATQFTINGGDSQRRNKDNSSSSEGPKPTKTSRLRSGNKENPAATPARLNSIEKLSAAPESGASSQSRRLERDKSSKRKSNLNRALNSEEVPSSELDDVTTRRRNRRFFPQDILDPHTAEASTPPKTTTRFITHKKSELSIHMENARKSVVPDAATAAARKPLQKRRESDSSSSRETPPRKTGAKAASRKMEELTALTRETLARVERLASRTKEAAKQTKKTSSPVKQLRSQPSSILKKKIEESVVVETVPNPLPVSILKRKISQEDSRGESHAPTPPVTFSPNVVEPTTTNRRQGILKKRRSLDESQVMRHRSCSPDVAAYSRSILKNQRRSSLEELTRSLPASEYHLHGILKRKTSRTEEDDHSLNSPQGILKRKSGASSAGSTSSSPHVSITTAVILAAAGGAEMILESPDAVKPILKKKSFSEENPHSETPSEARKPILKKKSSTETDDCDENRPRKPILKMSRASMEREDEDEETHRKPRLSFCGDDGVGEKIVFRNARRSHTICADFNVKPNVGMKDDDRELTRPRPISVSEMVQNFEGASTGAIPKVKRNSDRYRTQPVTFNELEASLNWVRSPQFDTSLQFGSAQNSILEFTSSLENDRNFNSFLLNSASPESGVGKMSSDSAFQSLGDGLELDQDEEKDPKPVKLEPSRLEVQMKAIAEEAQKMKLGRGNTGGAKYRRNLPPDRSSLSRFSTQPVTFDEVQEATKINKSSDSEDKDEPSKLSLFERIKLFNVKETEIPQRRDVPRRRLNRFQTQPITSDEVETARCIPPSCPLDDQSAEKSERKGILKSSFVNTRAQTESPLYHPRSVLKKRDSFDTFSDYESNRRSILKPDVIDITCDEGISCNDSASDSESVKSPETQQTSPLTRKKVFGKLGSSETSDGDSSGGQEIRSIFRNENQLKVKYALESILSKSKSQIAFGDESEVSKKSSSIRRSHTQSAMPRAIEEIQARLQQSGETGWKKRVQNYNANDELKLLSMNRYNDELSEKTILDIKKDELDASAKQWKTRVEKSDAEKFSVAGRMEKNNEGNLSINIPSGDNKRTPQAKRFKGKEGNDSCSTPVSPEKNRYIALTRSYSVPYPDLDSAESVNSLRSSGRKVTVSRPDDDSFKSFYSNLDCSVQIEQISVSLDDFDCVQRQSLLVQRKNVQVQKRRGASKNPIKALAERDDITDEYTEILTGVAERERKRLNIEKLAKTSSMAPAALAGLLSKEDFTSVALKKSTAPTILPYKSTMLLQIKGRQHVQTRLIEPTARCINEGDNFILVTPTTIFNYIGTYSNVIEQSRGADIINHIQQSGDLGCKDTAVVALSAKSLPSKHARRFWEILGGSEGVTSGGHPDEDSIYENNIIATNMIYKIEGNELVPFEQYWGAVPKIEMLQATKVIVFDFGSEMYVWSGKNAPIGEKRLAFRLAKELWESGYDYSDCSVCPLNVATVLGNRPLEEPSRTGKARPDWALFAKITQHRETILFKEKFLDWPDFTRVIKVKATDGVRVEAAYNLQPCDVDRLHTPQATPVDFVIEGQHVGRGDKFFDEEFKRLYEFQTLELTIWRIVENSAVKLDTVGEFSNDDSYIIKWSYRTTVKGRELSGKPSKFLQAGRDRCVYFCWQGTRASINEKGSAALLTVELDQEKAPQVFVNQGAEPPVFLRLFNGSMIIHDGEFVGEKRRLYMLQGDFPEETFLLEVACAKSQLRSRTSFLLIDNSARKISLWHGRKSHRKRRRIAKKLAGGFTGFALDEIEEGERFLESTGDYWSLKDSKLEYDYTMRLFHLSSISGCFEVVETLCPYRSELSSPYPFLQNDLYSASQPALFLLDNSHELWLWQGWWPERDEEVDLSDQTGSGAVRWQAERRAAMQTAVNYWRKSHSLDESVPAYLVWAGLEPLEFKNLFPFWVDRPEITELNLKEGKSVDSKVLLEKELALLSRTTFSLDELMQRPLPDGVDPTQLEIYLSPEEFETVLAMTKEEFHKMPIWKQTAVKKEKGLF